MSKTIGVGATAAVLVGGVIAGLQSRAVRSVDENVLGEYAGVYQLGPDAFVYLQLWNEFSGTSQVGAFDESGIALSTSVESRVEFQRDAASRITSLTWHREGRPHGGMSGEKQTKWRSGEVEKWRSK